MSKSALKDIVDIRLRELQERLDEKRITLSVRPLAKKWLCDKGYDPRYGARPLNRLIQTEIARKLADMILKGEAGQGSKVMVEPKGDGLILWVAEKRWLMK